MKNFCMLLCASAIVAPMFSSAIAATDSASATATVTAAIAIAQVSDLDFGSAVQGDANKTVVPATSENAENASFDISGDANTTFTITLPANSTVIMETGAGGVNETIAVDNFVSYPLAGANGLLDGSGQQQLFIGATRDIIGAAQVPGSYTTTFTVEVVY